MKRWMSLLHQTTLLFVVLAVGLALVLFSVKYEVQDLEVELSQVQRNIVGEQRALHVLTAEWSHLNEPARLRRLAERHLDLAPVTPRQIVSFASLPQRAAPVDGAALAAHVPAASPEENHP